jgi:hypothetical protein
MVEAFPRDPPPKYMLRDRDQIYGEIFRRRVKSLGLEEVLIAPRSTGSPEAVTRLRLPQNAACGFPALRSSEVGSQHS